MFSNHDVQRRIVFHGAAVLLVGLLCGLPSVVEVTGGSTRMWQAAHSALLMLGIWLIASAAVVPVLVLEPREAKGLVWSLVIAGYSFMTAVIIQAITGVRAVSPDVSPVGRIAFVANLFAVLSSFLAAALIMSGAYNGLRASRRLKATSTAAV
jgi:uncharacterized membrane protein HdeD (DUF308 family)